MKTLIYDLEIIKCIPDGKVRFSDLEYCEGWQDFENMGISVAAYTWIGGVPIVFDWSETDARSRFMDALASADIISGFNSINFDDNLLKANGVEVATGYDILLECRRSAYGSFDYHDQPKGHSYALDPITKANGMEKTGSGSLAPQWWQLGDRQKVRDYCANDVEIERATLIKLLEGSLINPNTGAPFDNVRPLSIYEY